MRPDIVVDCLYHGEVNPNIKGQPVSVHKSVAIMEQYYAPLPQTSELDNITTTVWLKKGEFVNQAIVKKILNYLATEGK